MDIAEAQQQTYHPGRLDGGAVAAATSVSPLQLNGAPTFGSAIGLDAAHVGAGWYERFGKRAFDIVVAGVVLLAVSPVLAVVWVTLRITLGRDVVIAQDRVGRHGSTFGMLKFRTMHWSRRGNAGPYHGPERRVSHKTDHDPRHTPVGRVLRKASLDELPQLFNVLRGDMSLVGPRPELASVVDGIGERSHPRHLIRPGMTGEWQVTVRQDGIPLHECFDGDLPYLDRIGLAHDLSIMFRTVGVVLSRGGR